MQSAGNSGDISGKRIEEDGNRSERGDDVADTRERAMTKRRGRSNGSRVDGRIDLRLQLQEQRGIARFPNPGPPRAFRRAHAPSASTSLPWIPPKPPFDMSTTTSPSFRSAAIARTMSSTWGT